MFNDCIVYRPALGPQTFASLSLTARPVGRMFPTPSPQPAELSPAKSGTNKAPKSPDATEFLEYKPRARTQRGSHYEGYLDKLGFGFDSKATEMRHKCIENVKAHFLLWKRKSEVESENLLFSTDPKSPFQKMVMDFLEKFGSEYWGFDKRDHLDRRDPSEGFLCSRDTTRKDSHFREMVEKLFNFRVKAGQQGSRGQFRREPRSKLPLEWPDQASNKRALEEDSAPYNTRGSARRRITIGSFLAPASPYAERSGQSHTSRISMPAMKTKITQPVSVLGSTASESMPVLSQPTVFTPKPQSEFTTRSGARPVEVEAEAGGLAQNSATIVCDTATPRPTTIATADTISPQPAELEWSELELNAIISQKVTLIIKAESQKEMFAVKASLSSSFKMDNFFTFLEEECNLSSHSMNASVFFTWDMNKGCRIRRTRMKQDLGNLYDELREAFHEHPEFMEKGCKVNVTVHDIDHSKQTTMTREGQV